MDDELARKIAAAVDQPGGPEGDVSLASVLASDREARAYASSLVTLDRALGNWARALEGSARSTRSEADWEAFAKKIEARLDEPLGEATQGSFAHAGLEGREFLAAPFADGVDDVAALNEPARTLERKAMAESHDDKDKDKDADDDLEGLAALVRGSSSAGASIPPPAVRPGPALADDAMDESSGVVDIKHLAELARRSVPPLTPVEKPADEKKSEAKSSSSSEATKGGEATPATEATKAAVPPATAASAVLAKSAEPEAKKGSPLVWVLPIALAAGVGGFLALKNNNQAPSSAAVAAQDNATPAAAAAEAPRVEAPSQSAGNSPAEPAREQAPTAAAPAVASAAGEGAASAASAVGAPAGSVAAPVALAAPVVAARESADREDTQARRAARAGSSSNDRGAAGASPNADEAAQGGRARSPALAAEAPAAPRVQAAATPTAPTRAVPPPATSPTPSASPSAAPPGRPRSVEDLMAAAVGSRTPAAAATPSAAPSAALPDRLSRSQVSAAMAPLTPAVRACTQGSFGTATVAMVIQGDGSVQSANVSGPFGGGVNECIANVVRRARFSPFARPSMPVVYPFVVQPREGE